MIEQTDDGGWSAAPSGRGSGWGNTLETWEDAEKWGVEDRQWGNKEGMWDKVIVDGSDKDSWPTVSSKAAIVNPTKSSATVSTNPEKGKNTSHCTTATSATPNSSNSASFSQTASSKSSNSSKWQTVYPAAGESWDIACDDSIDQAIDAAEAANENIHLGSLSGVASGGLGGLIGTTTNWDASLNSKDSGSIHSEEQGKSENASNSGLENCSVSSGKVEIASWNKTPGKGPKTDAPAPTVVSNIVSVSSWGATPGDSNSGWMEPLLNAEAPTNSTSTASGWKPPDTSPRTSTVNKPVENKVETKKTSKSSGWGDVSDSSSNWEPSADIAGTSCWDSAPSNTASKSDTHELKSDDKVSQWLQSSDISGSDECEWGQESREPDEGSEGSWDGWTTASSKRNRVSAWR